MHIYLVQIFRHIVNVVPDNDPHFVRIFPVIFRDLLQRIFNHFGHDDEKSIHKLKIDECNLVSSNSPQFIFIGPHFGHSHISIIDKRNNNYYVPRLNTIELIVLYS